MKPEDARPGDLIAVARAAVIAERSERTIRRWASPSGEKLRRWIGQPPDNGGPAPVLVSERELMAVLAMSGQEPRSAAPVAAPDNHPARALDMAARAPDSVQVAILEARLQVADLRAELGVVQAERDGLARQVEDLHGQRRRWDNERAELRGDIIDARDRARALDAELKALRHAQGLPWWRRLIGPAPALTVDDS